MDRCEKLGKLAEVLLLAASKAESLNDRQEMDGRSQRTAALAKQLEGIALEFRAMAGELREIDPSGE